MSLLKGMVRIANRAFPATTARAHCDIPCGIYDPHLAQIAALTTVRMNQLINDLPDHPGSRTDGSKLARYTLVKEEHAELVKRELRVLWGDYFKSEHLEGHPDLNTSVWSALKLAGKVKQEANLEAAEQLVAEVQKIAEIFWATKGADSKRQPSLQGPVGGEIVYPSPK
jgi:nickel superoxide dismutase